MTTDLTIQTVARLLYKKFFLLIIFGAFGLMLSSLYIINSDKEYISYFMFKVNYPVKEEVLELLEEKFRDEDIFSKWALEKNPKIISYDEFKSEMNVKSLSFYKERKNLKVDKKSNFFSVVFKDIEAPAEYLSYLNFLNDELSKNYINRLNKEKDQIESTYEKLIGDGVNIAENYFMQITEINQKIDNLSNQRILRIYPPTYPSQTYPSNNLLMILSFLIGFLIGLFYIFWNFSKHSKN